MTEAQAVLAVLDAIAGTTVVRTTRAVADEVRRLVAERGGT